MTPGAQPRQRDPVPGIRPARARLPLLGLVAALVAPAAALAQGGPASVPDAAGAPDAPEASAPISLPPAPGTILGIGLPRTPPIDAAAICTRWSVHAPSEQVLADDGAVAALVVWKEATESPAGADLFTGSLEARVATEPDALEAARAHLRRALDHPAPARARICALLEIARAELQLGRFPEAAASAREALTVAREHEDGLAEDRDRAHFLIAEAYLLGGRHEDAAALFLPLARVDSSALAAAARLRLADLRFDRGLRASALPEYELLVENGEAFGAESSAWAARAAEAAIDAGDFASAASWLERQPAEGDLALAQVTLRRADVLVALGKRDEGRDELEGVEAAMEGQPIAHLARLRVFDFGLERVGPDEAVETLRAVVRESRDPGVAGYARVVLARRLLARPDVESALPLLVRASYDVTAQSLLQEARSNLLRAVDLAVGRSREAGGCSWLLQVVDDHRTLLVNLAEEPASFLEIGRCYEEVGLPLAALEVYRGMSRRFGATVAASLALPIARSSLASGRTAAARTAAEAHVEQQPDASPAWRLLLAEVRVQEKRFADAARLLTDLVREDSPTGARELVLLARVVHAGDLDPGLRPVLREALLRRLEPESEGDVLAVAEAALLTGDLHRRAGEPRAAAELYARALDARAPAAVRAEAAWWLGRLDPARRTRALEVAAEVETEPFSRLARGQQALDEAAVRLGLSPPEGWGR